MWVCTSWGILMPGLRPEKTIKEGDDRVLQIRARRKSDLEMLRDKYMGDDLGEIFSLEHTDYEWRAYSTLEAWGKALGQIGADIDYVKFKETAEKQYNDHDLHSLYLSMWSTIFSHLSTVSHQSDYWSSGTGTGLYGSKGKYGTTYGGTGNFSTVKAGKKGKNRKAGNRSYYTPDQDPHTFLGTQPWWADKDDDHDFRNDYRDDLDDLGLGGYSEFIERELVQDALRSKSADTFASLLGEFGDLPESERPVFKPDNGNEIDHTFCDHGLSKSAKKRCRARWRRYARTMITKAQRVG